MCNHKIPEECILFHNTHDTTCKRTGEECPVIICERKCDECKDTPKQKMQEAYKKRNEDHRYCYDCMLCEYRKWCKDDGWVNS